MRKTTRTYCSTKKRRKKPSKTIIHNAISEGSCVAACWAWFAGFIVDGFFTTNLGKLMMAIGGGYVLLWAFANYFYPNKVGEKEKVNG